MKQKFKQFLRHFLYESRASVFFKPDYIASTKLRTTIASIINENKDAFANVNILDFGCGSKPYRNFFNTDHYIGLDTKQSGHDHLYNNQIDVFYDGSIIPFETGKFDSVVTFQVLEHVSNLEKSLTEIVRITKPGGHILISVPFMWCEHEAPYDFRRFTSFQIEEIAKKFKLQLIVSKKTTSSIEAITQQFTIYLMNITRTKSSILNVIATFILISPFTLLGMMASKILPDDKASYLDLVCLFKKELNV